MTDKNTSAATTHLGREAFDRLATLREAVDPAAATQYNLDATYAVAQARAIVGRLQAYRDTIKKLPGFDIGNLDRLGDYADALEFVHATLVTRAKRVRSLPELANEGYQLRTLLLAYGDLLVLKGTFPADVIARLREGTGYRDLIEDLNGLVVLYGEHPEALLAGAPVTPEQIARAGELARLMSDELGVDREANLTHDVLIKERIKIAHLLVTAHRELRRAMDYIRYHEGDASVLVPSLYVPSTGRKKKTDEPTLIEIHDSLHAPDQPHDHPHDNPFVDAEA